MEIAEHDTDPQHLKANPESLRVVLMEVEALYNALGRLAVTHHEHGCPNAPGLSLARKLVSIRLQQLRAMEVPAGSIHVN